MYQHVLVQLAYDRQREMRQAAGVERLWRRSSQERAVEIRSLEQERQRQRAALQLRQAE